MTQGAFFDRSYDSDTVPTVVDAFPRIAVVVEAAGSAEHASETLDSLRRVRYPNLETLLVTDDGVGDEPTAILERYPEVSLVRIEPGERGVPGLNLGIGHALAAGAQYILLLTTDAELDPVMPAELVDAAEASASVGCVGPLAYCAWDRERAWPSNLPVAFRSPVDGGSETDREWLDGCGLLIKRSVLEQVGLFDPTYAPVRAGADWCLRVRRGGFRCRQVPRARLWRRTSESAAAGPTEDGYLSGRDGALLARRHARGLEWARFWIGVAGRIPAVYLAGLLRGERDLARRTWRGVMDGMALPLDAPPRLLRRGRRWS